MFRGKRHDEHVAAFDEVDQGEWELRKDVSPRSRQIAWPYGRPFSYRFECMFELS